MAGLKRILELQDLSRDHYHALLLARQARLAAESADPELMRRQWVTLQSQFPTALEPHFLVEESVLCPALEAAGETHLVLRLKAEHTAIRACLATTSSDLAARLASFGRLLQHHVRFEETEVFEVAQQVLTAAQLQAIAHAARGFERPWVSCAIDQPLT